MGEPYFPQLCVFYFHMLWREVRNWVLQPGPRVATQHWPLPNLPLSGNHFRIGRLAKFHWTFVSGEEYWALVYCSILFFFFCSEGVGPQGTASAAGHFDRSIHSLFLQPSICAVSQHAKSLRMPLTALGAGKKGDYGLLLWKKFGSCCWGCFLVCHSFLVPVGWEPECPTSKRLL